MPITNGSQINEQIEQISESKPPNSFVHIVCECGYDTCDLFIAVLKEEYEEVRDDPLASSSFAAST